MSGNKWTPGPWKFNEFGSQIVDSAKGSSQQLIARVAINTYHDQGRYNAYLIAAAPDMYEALMNLVDEVDGMSVIDPITKMHIDQFVDAAYEAAKKARGES